MRIETNVHTPPRMRLMYPFSGVTNHASLDEKITTYQEGYALAQDGGPDHRYAVAIIPRGNVMQSFWIDLGPATQFEMQVDGQTYLAPDYRQLVLSEHSLAECMFYANRDRKDEWAIQLLHTQVNESDLFAQYYRLIEEDYDFVKNRSVFGPHGKTERNDYSPYGAREIREAMHGR